MENDKRQLDSLDRNPLLDSAQKSAEWYAVYTSAHHEKKVAEQIRLRSIEYFLPLYETVHRWKDRRVRLQLPLFPGYVLVHTIPQDHRAVVQIPGVVRFVSFNGAPAPLPEDEIEALRMGLASGLRAEPHPYLSVGRRVRVKAGPLCGVTGKLVRRKQHYRIVISIDAICRSLLCEVSLEDLEAIPSSVRQSGSNGPGKNLSRSHPQAPSSCFDPAI